MTAVNTQLQGIAMHIDIPFAQVYVRLVVPAASYICSMKGRSRGHFPPVASTFSYFASGDLNAH